MLMGSHKKTRNYTLIDDLKINDLIVLDIIITMYK